jgi:hypothetical protein
MLTGHGIAFATASEFRKPTTLDVSNQQQRDFDKHQQCVGVSSNLEPKKILSYTSKWFKVMLGSIFGENHVVRWAPMNVVTVMKDS